VQCKYSTSALVDGKSYARRWYSVDLDVGGGAGVEGRRDGATGGLMQAGVCTVGEVVGVGVGGMHSSSLMR
jgi:hypothetical protein